MTFRCVGALQLNRGGKAEVYWLKGTPLTFPHLCFSDKTFMEALWHQGQGPFRDLLLMCAWQIFRLLLKLIAKCAKIHARPDLEEQPLC